jgi:hypothetical protein
MTIFLGIAAAAGALASIDTAALELHARAEALQPSRASSARSGTRTADIATVRIVCPAAANQSDPAAFLGTLARAYRLTSAEAASLQSACAAYMAGRADTATQRLKGVTY